MTIPPSLSILDISSSPLPTQLREPTSSHRLPTVSASQALQHLDHGQSGSIPTGLRSLDVLLSGCSKSETAHGLQRGKVTEFWGPSGSGKTAIALQAAATCLRKGDHVVWLGKSRSNHILRWTSTWIKLMEQDAATPISGARLSSAMSSTTTDDSTRANTQALKNLRHIALPSLSHLLALIIQPATAFPPENTALVVLDDLNILLDHDYPRIRSVNSKTKPENAKWAASRRYAVLGTIGTALRKLAALEGLTVIVTTSCATRGRQDRMGPVLVPGVGGSDEWETAVACRAVVFRDYGMRLVGLQKCHGQSTTAQGMDSVGEVGQVCAFAIANDGTLQEYRPPSDHATRLGPGAMLPEQPLSARVSSPVKSRKRMHHEIADSEDEDVDEYGWHEDDDDAIAAEGLVNEVQDIGNENDGDIEEANSDVHENG